MSKTLLTLIASFLISSIILSAQEEAAKHSIPQKSIEALRVDESINIDGRLDEAIWQIAPIATDFVENYPEENAPPSQKTEVRFLYDNTALYVGAMCYDTAADSILSQLGDRDAGNLNADDFMILLDTYNSQLDAYRFGVYASGVQKDSRISDGSYNAVWYSKVQKLDNGWSLEFKIPYSAIRFANEKEQEWGLQISRGIRRFREFDIWSYIPKGEENYMNYWGKLKGIRDVEAPIRLQFTPYLVLSTEHFPYDEIDQSNWNSAFSGGMDVKYGINESFTLDMTLLPDFSQVQSDNQIKNLGAFEVVFDEQRPFFQEGTELFSRGDLFYSRRIGGRPVNYFDAENQVGEGETLVNNPNRSRLLNATKISGRNSDGLALGVFNAIAGRTYAEIENVNGKTRDYLTNPITNYNILVLDKNLQNNSSVYLINTNVRRGKDFRNANVTGLGFSVANNKGSYQVSGDVAYSDINDPTNDDFTKGFQYELGLSKTSGKFKFDIYSEAVSRDFNSNDLGVNFYTNTLENGLTLYYNEYNPFWKVNNLNNNISFNFRQNYETKELADISINTFTFTTWSKYFLAQWLGIEAKPMDRIDYWEARQDGQIFRAPGFVYAFTGISSDYRKKFALDASIGHGRSRKYGGGSYTNFSIKPIYRVNDKLALNYQIRKEIDRNNIGFSTFDEDDNSIFGGRDINNWTNILEAKYLFQNNMSLSFRARHYWSQGQYQQFYNLKEDGYLEKTTWNENQDFNFNAFNIDLVYFWQFAPGSSLNIVYKNAILNDSDQLEPVFFNNFRQTFEYDQLNSFSIKLLYFFDYLYLKDRFRK